MSVAFTYYLLSSRLQICYAVKSHELDTAQRLYNYGAHLVLSESYLENKSCDDLITIHKDPLLICQHFAHISMKTNM